MVSRMRWFSSSWKLSAVSRMSANCLRDSATAVLRTVLQSAMELDEPTIRNSNLFPVNAKGEVLFLSVVSFGSFGRISVPR